MADIQDNNNTHLFLNTVDSANNSFIANVNSLANKLQDVLVLNTLFNPKNVADLSDLAQIDITTLIEDLKKGSINDSRKLDIDLLRNFKDYDDKLTDEDKRLLWNDPTKQVYYDSIIATFLDGTVLTKVFSTLVNNHHKLYSEVDEWEEFKVKATHTLFDVSEDTPIFGHELFRITDIIGTVGSQLASIKLTVAPDGQNTEYDAVFAGVKTRTPTYTWLDTSSTISILAVRAERLIQLSLSTGQLGILVTYIKELLEIFNVLDKLTGAETSIYKVLDELVVIYNNLEDLLALYAQAEELTNLPDLITNTAITEKKSLEDLSYTLQNAITSVGNTQTIRVQNTGTLQEQKVITAGTAQINLAKAEADRAKAEADRASSLVGIGAATSTTLGLIKVGDNLAITGEGVLSAIIPDNPIATTSTAGTVMVGNGLSITNEGILSTDTVDIPTASTEELGLVKIGNGLSIDDNGTVSAIVPEIQPTSEIYISGTEEDGVIPLSITKPTEDIIIPWNITQTSTKKVFRYTYDDDGTISALSRYAFRLYMNSMETQQVYNFSSRLIANVNGMNILIGGNLYSNKFSVTNPMVDIPLDNNVLVSNVPRKAGDYFKVEIYIEKSSGSADTAYISAGNTFDSKLIRNGVEIASNNIVDFDGVIVRTQAQVNRDLAKPATAFNFGIVKPDNETITVDNGIFSYGKVTSFHNFYEQTPPKGWKVRNGAVLNNAEIQFPVLWEVLKSPENAWKLKTLSQWTALSTAAGGVGGVPFFVLDEVAKTIKLPDTRGDYERGSGSTYLSAVGAWHEDAIRNITGGPLTTLSASYTNKPTLRWEGALGVVAVGLRTMAQDVSNGAYSFSLGFDASKDSNVLTAPENRTRAFAVLPCVYVGGI